MSKRIVDQPNQDTLNRLAILRILLASPINMVEVDRRYVFDGTPYWNGPLNEVIRHKNYPLANELLKYPNRIDPTKPEQFPPIDCVALHDFWEIGIELANLPNVNLNAVAYDHRTALQYAADYNCRSVIERVLLPHQDRINVNYMHENEPIGTALHCVIAYARNDIIPLLLSFRNIDVNVIHPIHGPPFVYSLKQSKIEAARILIKYTDCTNVNLATHEGQTALALACREGYVDIVRTLLAFPNIDINSRENYRLTPLHRAVMKQSPEIVKLLVQDPSKCDVNAQDKNGCTPFHEIFQFHRTAEDKQRQYEIINILGAVPTINFNLPNDRNETVVDIAMRIGDSTVVTELVKFKDRFDISLREKYNL